MTSKNKILTKIKQSTPISTAEDYSLFRDPNDEIFRDYIKEGKIYIIGQRPSLYFSSLVIDSESIGGTIKQDLSGVEVKFSFSVLQTRVLGSSIDEFEIKVSGNPGISEKSNVQIFDKGIEESIAVDSISLLTTQGDFLLALTPDIVLWRYVNNDWNFDTFSKNYHILFAIDVLYVGEAARRKGGVVERLYGHEKFLQIILQQKSFNSLVSVKKEIVIVPFEINISYVIGSSFNENSSGELSFNQPDFVPLETIFIDLEKAMINIFEPPYNKKRYKDYPKSAVVFD